MHKKTWLLAITIVIVLLIVGDVMVQPYLRGPLESREDLEVRYVEFKKVADEVQNRPKADMEAFLALVTELEPVLKKESEKNRATMGLRHGSEVPCPSYNIEDIRKSEADIKEVLSRDDRLRAILEDGFIVQQDTNPDCDFPNFFWIRKYLYAQLAAAVLEADQGKTGAATDRILMQLLIADEFLKTPVLIHSMVGVAMADRIDEIVISLAPKLSDEELKRIREAVTNKPDAIENILKAFQTEIAWAADSWSPEYFNKHPDNFKETFQSAIPLLGKFWFVIKHTGIVKNARWNYLSLSTRIYDFYREWSRGDRNEIPDLPAVLKDEFKTNIAAAVGIPNYGSLLEKGNRANIHKKSMLDAIDAELAQRQSGTRTKLEMPYDDKHQIVIENDFGCIVKKE